MCARFDTGRKTLSLPSTPVWVRVSHCKGAHFYSVVALQVELGETVSGWQVRQRPLYRKVRTERAVVLARCRDIVEAGTREIK